jgi:predicted MFS family arabinose efflux permease
MSYLFGLLAEKNGFGSVFQILAGLIGVVLLVVFLIPYQRRVHPLVVASQWSSLLQGFYLVFAAFGIVYSIASFGTDGLWTLYLSEVLHAGSRQIGNFGMARGVGALIGAGLYALSTRRLGLMRAQFLAIALLGLGCLLPLSGLPWYVCGIAWGMCWGFQETSFVTIAMRYAEGPWAATFFAVSMIFSNVGTSLGEALAAPLVPTLGFQGVFLGMAVIAWASMALIRPMLKPLRS